MREGRREGGREGEKEGGRGEEKEGGRGEEKEGGREGGKKGGKDRQINVRNGRAYMYAAVCKEVSKFKTS